jgi:hypothetical protein
MEKLNKKQMEAVGRSIKSWAGGEVAFGHAFSAIVQNRINRAVERFREHEPNEGDLQIGAIVIFEMPYRRPEDRTIHSYRAAQRKLKHLMDRTHTLVGLSNKCDINLALFETEIKHIATKEGLKAAQRKAIEKAQKKPVFTNKGKSLSHIYDVVGRLQKQQKQVKINGEGYKAMQYQIDALIWAADEGFTEGAFITYFKEGKDGKDHITK